MHSTGDFRNIAEKRAGETTNTLEIQTSKNVRLNKTLICALRGLGTIDKEPYILDIHGTMAIVYTIKRHRDGYYFAGKVMEERLELPDSAQRMKTFLDNGSLAAICNIVVSGTGKYF
jgi:hypothetical protein